MREKKIFGIRRRCTVKPGLSGHLTRVDLRSILALLPRAVSTRALRVRMQRPSAGLMLSESLPPVQKQDSGSCARGVNAIMMYLFSHSRHHTAEKSTAHR